MIRGVGQRFTLFALLVVIHLTEEQDIHEMKAYMGAYLGKGTYWQFLHEFDCRETTLSNAANHLKKFLIEFEICLYEHLYFLYIRNPLFPIVVFVSLLWQLKVNMFYPKYSFPIV